jgi:uncharacterized membrane protein YfcA
MRDREIRGLVCSVAAIALAVFGWYFGHWTYPGLFALLVCIPLTAYHGERFSRRFRRNATW